MKRFSMAMTWLALAGLMTTVSCRKPVVGFTNGEARTVTVSAVTENGDGSKTSIDGLYVKWSEGDEISMNGCKLTLEEGAGGTMGRFTGDVTSSGPYLIGYPFDKTNYNGGTLKLTMPATLIYDAGKQIVPMVAYAADVDDDVYFRNAVNMLKLQLKGDDTPASKLKSIVLTSTTSNLSGDINVTFNGGVPEFAAIAGDGASKTMTVSFGEEGLQLKADEVKCVYIPLAKISVDDVLTVRFNCANGKYMERKVTADANFNAVNNMLYDELTVNATDKDHETVNMGLPTPYDKLEWSVYNLGVDPDDLDAAEDWYGDYYAWGETKTKSNYDYSTYRWCIDNWSNLTKYCAVSYFSCIVDNKTVLDLEDDAARANWGVDWRMPTSAEWKALYDNSTLELLDADATSVNVTSFKAVAAGYLVIKGKGPSLDPSVYMFLPAAGGRIGTSLGSVGSDGFYWSSSCLSSSGAYLLYFCSGNVTPEYAKDRYFGFSVRLVR